MTYDPRQSFAAQQLAYSRAAGTQTSKQQGLSKGRGTPISKSRSLGAFEPDPAQRNTTTRSTYTPPTRRNTKKNKGSTYDEVPQVLTQGIVQRPKPKPTKETGYQKVTRIFNEAMSGFGDFEVPTQPTFDTVKPQNLYKDKRYFGPQVYTPDTSQFGRGYEKKYFLGMELPTGSPSLPKSLKRSNVNIFGNTKDHPRLNMFGVKRSYTRNPDSLMAPPTMSKPEINFDDRTELLLGTRNAVARALDFVEDSDPQTTIITSQHTVEKGESVLSIVEDFNRDKPDKEKVTLEEVGELNNIPNVVENPFGRVQKGDILQIPVKKETAVQVLRQEIERERKVKKELLEFKRLSGEQKIKVLKEKGIIPEESIRKISDIGELSSGVEAELEDILLALEKETGSKEDLTDLSQAGSNTTEGLKNVATKEPKQFKITMDEVKDFAKERFDPVQAAAFVATFDAETGGGRAMVEDPYTKAGAIRKFVKGNSEIMQKRKAALEKAKNSEEIFNIVYGDDYRTDEYKLGNNLPGDGFKYRGRGPLMITGKTNYKKVGDAIGVDLVNNPDLLRTDKDISIKAAMAYLSLSGFDDVSSATQLANVVRHSNPKGKEGMRRWKNAGKFYKEMYGTFMPTKKPKARPAGLMEKYTSLRPKLRPER